VALLSPIFQLLKAAPAVTAILGATPKVFRHGAAPQGTVAPYVVWSVINDDPENSLSEAPGSDRQTLQIDCYHTTDGGIEQLAEAVRNALEPHAHLTGMPIDQQEPDTRLFRIALQFDYWLKR
jgi:hypothetical protein